MSTKNINNLRDVLFEQLNAIRSAETVDEVELEHKRARAMIPIAESLLNSAVVEMKFIDTIGKVNPDQSTGFITLPDKKKQIGN